MKFNAKDILKPALILFAICLVASALLGFTDSITRDRIAEQASKAEKEARLLVLPQAESFEEKVNYCIGKGSDGALLGYVFTTVEKGYGGDLKILTGVDPEGKVTGVQILEISETAGLGMNANKEEFRNQFIGKTSGVSVVKDEPSGNEVKALTGATITSKAVTKAVNDALELFSSISGGEN